MCEFLTFEDFFKKATGFDPYPYQVGFAKQWGDILEVPTGCGKTEAIVLGWLWRRLCADESTRQQTPRRLAYCLPMRVLVEQTAERVRQWLENLGLKDQIQVWILMGGEVDDDWDIYPEREQILIGTQDMLLSRALNRGYAMSRYRWPVQFGLLNNDCQWVFDEVQLMGNGLATSAQLAAFRKQFGVWGKCPSLWVSATFSEKCLETVDFQPHVSGLRKQMLSSDDRSSKDIQTRLSAKKTVTRAGAKAGEAEKLADEILRKHKVGTLTLAVQNTVVRTVELYEVLKRKLSRRSQGSASSQGKRRSMSQQSLPMEGEQGEQIELLLLHSRFRPLDRRKKVERLKALQQQGGIVVSTQVVEAGVDISARVLFTELCPWPSFVQRVGRCNRRGEFEDAEVVWVDVRDKDAAPYHSEDLKAAREKIVELKDASPQRLAEVSKQETLFKCDHTHVIRAHDLYGLFSTEADLHRGYTDVSHFVRNAEPETDVYVFWRDFEPRVGPGIQPAPHREELCPVRLYRLREFLGKEAGWIWNPETRCWERVRAKELRAGMTILLSTKQGGYSEELGWTGKREDKPKPVQLEAEQAPDSLSDEPTSGSLGERQPWVKLTDHLLDVEAEAKRILKKLDPAFASDVCWRSCAKSLELSARWHDVGKATERWQKAGREMLEKLRQKLDGHVGECAQQHMGAYISPPEEGKLWAKFPNVRLLLKAAGCQDGITTEPFLPGLRHEAASALLAWEKWRKREKGWTALAVYLVACHHGKVRTVLRSIELSNPQSSLEDVFGVREGDSVKSIPGWLEAETRLNLAPKALGAPGKWEGDEYVMEDAGGWTQMVAELLGPEPPDVYLAPVLVSESEPHALGPFRLAYLEALIRAADASASRYPGRLRNS